ncbi:hypothetical protein [Leptolyngbya sp. FACHB-261]|uniref:hypothetical protein n=1 Tax=Leptolyngbya sp. FACHB-261 TaxID=2692806 RepID=UPI001684E4EA|nr:hypothetical protein [Leptolyngbya sp. FACHB-261]MBD2103593.1 hypothetical protein [Leptolyngbya sp. FACHB-261]
MGLLLPEQKAAYNYEAIRKRLAAQAQEYFEPQLAELGFSKSQIETQSLDELRQSLESINEAIKHPGSFGSLSFSVGAEGKIFVTSSKSNAQFEIGILPLLLDRKKLILEKIRILSSNEKIETIQDLINRVNNEEIKKKLEKEVNELRDEAQRLREQSKEVEQEQNQERVKSQADLAKLNIELFERRSKVWFTLLERESAATILGGILLFIILIAHVTAIFTKFSIPEILNNAFLIILGYFFGQSTNEKGATRSDRTTVEDEGT